MVNEAQTQARLQTILSFVEAGLSRDQIAEALQIKKPSVDASMRRGGFGWDKRHGKYVKKSPVESFKSNPDRFRKADQRVQSVIDALREPGVVLKAVANRLGFESAVQMGKYMKARGHEWSGEIGNYVATEVAHEEDEEPTANVVAEFSGDSQGILAVPLGSSTVFQRYLPTLVWLEQHQKQLMALLNTGTERKTQIPRYMVPGRCDTKSVYMASSLAQLVKDFAQEKNVPQRDIFEVALILFFRQFGYDKEVEAALNLGSH